MSSGGWEGTPAEFTYAAEGDVDALRGWLLGYPDRINLQDATTAETLLHRAAVCGRMSIVKMLVSEFRADMGVPCGALLDTCLHIAAKRCDLVMLSFLIESGAPLKANALNRYPIDLVLELGVIDSDAAECVKKLREYEEMLKLNGPSGASTSVQSAGVPCPASLLSEVKKESPKVYSAEGFNSGTDASQIDLLFNMASADATVLEKPRPLRGSRNSGTERKSRTLHFFSSEERLPYDLHEFREAYGAAFNFYESHEHYYARGLLPYNYNGTVYYTPLILLVVKLHKSDKNGSRSESKGSPIPSVMPGGNANHVVNDSRGSHGSPYRSIIDRKNLAGLLINRKATYIDPCSGVIIPSEADVGCRSLKQYVKDVVLACFEHIPPLTNNSAPARAVCSSGPLFSFYPDMRYIKVHILRELSATYASVFTYDSSTRTVEGHIPIIKVIELPSLEVQVPGSTVGNVNEQPNTVSALESDVVLRLPLRLQFSMNGHFDDAPRVYFPTAASGTAMGQVCYNMLHSIVIDCRTGAVNPDIFPSIQLWRQHGSLQRVLLELQEKATSLVMAYCKEDAVNLSGTYEFSADWSTTGKGEGSSTCGDDLLLLSPPLLRTGGRSNFHEDSCASVKGMSEAEVSSKCIFCLDRVKDALLLPCRHLALCTVCSAMYGRNRGEGMLCPICRAHVEQTIKVYV
uniref:WGS project CAEQ00000000 data, annotated contig 796 n=1 Tax=Trypanosoma congolense (strain IL3000) TaxID=1068625 RepID=F9WII1_TRYCI|nr:unnamed protein product [Trypanosoma congolense IL3000]